jgi:hypothetical protein
LTGMKVMFVVYAAILVVGLAFFLLTSLRAVG